MNDLPRGPMEPLPAPAGAFESVTRRARARRVRMALLSAGLGLAVVTGGVVALPADRLQQPDRLVPAHPRPTPSGQATVSPTDSAAPFAAPTPVPPTASSAPTFTGRVVDESGRPLAGIFVSRYTPGNVHADEHDIETSATGTFVASCGGKLLFSSWRTGFPQSPETRNLALRWLTGDSFETTTPAPCDVQGQRPTQPDIVMLPGAVLEGDLYFEGIPRTHEDLNYGLMCGPRLGTAVTGTLCAAWPYEGNRYRFVGLSAGTYRLRSGRASGEVSLSARQTTTRDWYECDECTNGRPSPP